MTEPMSITIRRLARAALASLACLSAAACSSTDTVQADAVASSPGFSPAGDDPFDGNVLLPPAQAAPVYLDLAVATLPWDPAPPPTDMNGFILEVADAGVLGDAARHTWLESPANLPLRCPPAGAGSAPCRATLGPMDISHVVAAGRPLLLRSRPTSHLSSWQTLSTVLSATAPPGDGNTISGTVYVVSQGAMNEFVYQLGLVRAQGGILALMTDPNGQQPAGARLALVDPSLVGQAPASAVASGLLGPGWGTVDMAYLLSDLSDQAVWTEDLVSAAVFASTPLVSSGPALPAAWMGVRDGNAPLVSDIVPLDLAAGALVILPLTLAPIPEPLQP